MAPMKPQPISDGSLSEAEAIRIVRGLNTQATCARPTHPAERQNVLAHALENEVIPRLLAANRQRKPAAPEESPVGIPQEQVDRLSQLVLQAKQSEATAYVAELAANGVSAPRLFLDLLAPAARKLGAMWEEDACDFADVTMGVMRLRNVMRQVGDALEAECSPGPDAARVLLFQAPGEQHGFGLAMVTHFFRAAGYAVQCEPAATPAALVETVARDWFGLIGVSVACEDHLPSVSALLAELRRASRNKRLGIMAGGNAFAMRPGLAREIGADLAATDGWQAVNDAKALLARLAHEQ